MMKTTRKRKAANGRRPRKASAAQYIQDNTEAALGRGRDTLSRAYGWAHDAAGSNLGSLRMPRRSDLAHLAEANPLLLGAVGLGLGVAIATLFPSSLGLRSSGRSQRITNGTAPRARSTRRRRRKARANSAAAG